MKERQRERQREGGRDLGELNVKDAFYANGDVFSVSFCLWQEERGRKEFLLNYSFINDRQTERERERQTERERDTE